VQVVLLYHLLEQTEIMDLAHALQVCLHLAVVPETEYKVNIPELLVALVVEEEMVAPVEPR
jgi:hypothetical protein